MDLTSTYKMLRGFEEQSVLLDEKTEVINETMDGIFEVDGGEIDGTLSSVFEEIGLDLHKLMDNNKTNTLQMQESQDNIEERFARLVANK